MAGQFFDGVEESAVPPLVSHSEESDFDTDGPSSRPDYTPWTWPPADGADNGGAASAAPAWEYGVFSELHEQIQLALPTFPGSRTPGANAAEPVRAQAPNTTAASVGVRDVSRADDPPAPTVDAEDEESISGRNAAVFCRQCRMWLNGPTQWWDHVIGKKHQRSVHSVPRTTPATPLPAGWGAAEPEEEPDDLVLN